jgi:hypothetical protein
MDTLSLPAGWNNGPFGQMILFVTGQFSRRRDSARVARRGGQRGHDEQVLRIRGERHYRPISLLIY